MDGRIHTVFIAYSCWLCKLMFVANIHHNPLFFFVLNKAHTRDVFYVRREVDLMKTAKVNAYIMHIFGKIEL